MKTPGKDNRYYLRKASGGWSPCILGNDKYGLRPYDGSVLPNCVSWATGRFNELLKMGSCKYLGNANAVDFTKWTGKQDLILSVDPAPGACMVWGGGAGHVAIVEEVISIDEVKTSESGWNYKKAPIVREVIRKRGTGSWGEKSKPFLGFILPPDLKPAPDPKPAGPEFITYTVKKGDCLSRIAKKYYTTVSQICADNPIIKNRNLIKVGWKLKIRKGE